MLQITSSAATLLKEVRAGNNVPDDAAFRIQPVATPQPGDAEIGFAFTGGPEAGDQAVTEDPDLRVYVSSELAAPLEGAVLDTIDTPGGKELQLRVENHDHSDHEGHDHSDHEGHDHP
jgi:Fe-S cluster assembly iron-binding protein IscA